MFHPFLDTSKLTDKEIQEKLQHLYGILTYQDHMGHAGMYDNVLLVIKDLETEQQVRLSNKMIEKDLENSRNLEFGEVKNELGIDYDNED